MMLLKGVGSEWVIGGKKISVSPLKLAKLEERKTNQWLPGAEGEGGVGDKGARGDFGDDETILYFCDGNCRTVCAV